ncbi:hypothetical protein QQF54_05435 [Lelliottia sp. V106_10]|uniref:hypothetical protein n=1 Tax=Lelliottia wanjuensis TaxID=3050585 RepID=UPI00254C3BFC|nr:MULTISPECIES: hypothetical protein [unclassified Lelliottia]MDK9357710.1 hypothetical protein [Lelliottia sp. V106_16]MDK9372798.1 hypothetical protein [Lelliottia sp. V106_10]MDK9599602.1 hypothetical protein [Lelliottia sp. V106_5]
MKIFIDESGLFNAHRDVQTKDKAWCAVGAITIPHKNEKKVYAALSKLKKKMNSKRRESILLEILDV